MVANARGLEIYADTWSGNWGWRGLIGHVSRHLTAQQAFFGNGLHEINLGLYYRWRSLEPETVIYGDDARSYAFEEVTLPKRRFRRSREVLDIEWRSPRMVGRDVKAIREENITSAQFRIGLDDLIDAIGYGLGSVKPSDDVDVGGLMEWLRDQRSRIPREDSDLRARLQADEAAFRKIMSGLNEWEKLGLDWRDFHADARRILDDPSDWDPVDDFSPHGNGTGADILENWSRNARSSPRAVADRFGFIGQDPASNRDEWMQWALIHLGLAFGHIKKRATCPPDLARRTRAVLTRERVFASAQNDWPHRDEWLGRLDRYDRILARFAE
jgi:hypothetical protein